MRAVDSLSPKKRGINQRPPRYPRTFDPIARARRVSRRVSKGRPARKPETCKPTKAGARDNVTGWFIYYCGTGVLLVPSERCVGPECRGAGRAGTLALGFAGDIGAGTRGSFMAAGRSIGVTAMDGVEIAQGVAAINGLQESGEIDGYYAAAAKRAYLEKVGEMPEREAPFETPSPFGEPLAPGALKRQYAGKTGEEVGPSVREGCGCTPRKEDARDPVSGWLIYYVPGGVLLTPSRKCIAGGGRAPGFWGTMWRNIVNFNPLAPTPTPAGAEAVLAARAPSSYEPGPVTTAPPPPEMICCIRPLGWWPRGPVPYPGPNCPSGLIRCD